MINIKTDSRRIKEGDIFVALRGIRTDGHDYIEDAIRRGAKKIVAEEGKYSVPTLLVDDTREYLNQYLTENYNQEFEKIQIIGITGTNGKTTVCHLLRQSLNQVGHKCASIGTLGFYIGEKLIEDLENSTPDLCDLYEYISLALDEGCEYILMEVSSHSLMNGRVETLLFDHAIFTNLTQDHLDYHITMENYVLAKQKLFKKIKPNGVAIVNIDDPVSGNFLFPNNHNITYGYGDADFKILEEKLSLEGTTFTFRYQNDIYQVDSKLIGKYNIYNLMPTLIFLLCIGIDPVLMLKTVHKLTAPIGRYDMIPYGTNKIIIDYAHTPDAILKVLETTKQFIKGEIYVVFGCTGGRDRLKRPIMTRIVSENSKYFIITEDDLYYEDFEQIKNDMLHGVTKQNYEVCVDRKEAIIKGISYLKENDALLILGKGHEDTLKIKEKRLPFNDEEVVLSYLQMNKLYK
jgi:UDP-N-acetylmuramoyl-L-alanyl-D-glutamate--2,6-diaminopimelate ligase